MNNIINAILGIGIIGGIMYNAENIKIEVMKQYGIFKAKEITVKFFKDEIRKNPKITLDEAILKFEDTNKEYSSLEEFSKDKTRTVESYRNAYKNLFRIAKKL